LETKKSEARSEAIKSHARAETRQLQERFEAKEKETKSLVESTESELRREKAMGHAALEKMKALQKREKNMKISDVLNPNDVLNSGVGDRLGYLSRLGKIASANGTGEDMAKLANSVRKNLDSAPRGRVVS